MMICLFQNVQELLEQSAYNWLGCHHRGVEASRIIIQHMWRYLELWHQDTLAHTFDSKPCSLGSWDTDSSNSNLGTRNASSSHCFLGLQWEVVVLVTGCPEGCPEWASGGWAQSRTVGHVSRPPSIHSDARWEISEAQPTTPRDEESWCWGAGCADTWQHFLFGLPDNPWAFSKRLQPPWDNIHLRPWGSLTREAMCTEWEEQMVKNTNLEKSIFKKWVDRSQLGEKMEREERQMLRGHRG